MDIKNYSCSQAKGSAQRAQAQERLMARIRIAECERAAGTSRDAFEALAELETKLGLA